MRQHDIIREPAARCVPSSPAVSDGRSHDTGRPLIAQHVAPGRSHPQDRRRWVRGPGRSVLGARTNNRDGDRLKLCAELRLGRRGHVVPASRLVASRRERRAGRRARGIRISREGVDRWCGLVVLDAAAAVNVTGNDDDFEGSQPQPQKQLGTREDNSASGNRVIGGGIGSVPV